MDKYCPRCEQTLDAEAHFHKNRSAPDGYAAYCKPCRNANFRTPEEREKRKVYMRQWNEKHREQVNANATVAYHVIQAKRQEDPELDKHLRQISRAKSRRAYQRNPAKAIAATASYAKDNKPTINKTRRERNAKHPEKIRAQQAKRYASRRNAPINDLTAADWDAIKAHYRYRCVYCPATCKDCRKGTHKLTKEHLTPLSKGGAHTLSNVVPACRSCNGKRGNRHVLLPVQPLLL